MQVCNNYIIIIVVYNHVQEEQYHKHNGHTRTETMEHFSSDVNETTKLLNSQSHVSNHVCVCVLASSNINNEAVWLAR